MDIWSACAEGNLEYVKGYIAEGRDINARDTEYGGTPLTWASQYGQKKVVEILLENGDVEIESADENGRTSLILASVNGWENIVKLLVKKGACINAYSDGDLTALMEASRNGHENVVRILVENGADTEFSQLPTTKVAGLQLPDVAPTSSGGRPPIVPSNTEVSEKGVALRAH